MWLILPLKQKKGDISKVLSSVIMFEECVPQISIESKTMLKIFQRRCCFFQFVYPDWLKDKINSESIGCTLKVQNLLDPAKMYLN